LIAVSQNFLVFILLIFTFSSSFADELNVEIIDVGSGSCSIAKLPDQKYLMFDAGHWIGKKCLHAAKRIIKTGKIELLILSHGDADHIGDASKILTEFDVATLIRTGHRRTSKTWKKFDAAVKQAELQGMSVINASDGDQLIGKRFSFAETRVTLLYGKAYWDGERLSLSESRNAISIVAKLEYANKAILFPGDTIGRSLKGGTNECSAAEHAMVLNQNALPLNADVLIAPHHGANNASSLCFITAVAPKYVIFPAGHNHGHPALATKLRYTNFGIQEANLFRTDLNDVEESSPFDWEDNTKSGCKDKSGDDDVMVKILSSGEISVNYRTPHISYCSMSIL
jgi:competence protein ComEC